MHNLRAIGWISQVNWKRAINFGTRYAALNIFRIVAYVQLRIEVKIARAREVVSDSIGTLVKRAVWNWNWGIKQTIRNIRNKSYGSIAEVNLRTTCWIGKVYWHRSVRFRTWEAWFKTVKRYSFNWLHFVINSFWRYHCYQSCCQGKEQHVFHLLIFERFLKNFDKHTTCSEYRSELCD